MIFSVEYLAGSCTAPAWWTGIGALFILLGIGGIGSVLTEDEPWCLGCFGMVLILAGIFTLIKTIPILVNGCP
ncbi:MULTISPECIES: hypothetical protein [unclassified Streptomyces]|uniref:hypothetical protein n=1 Tax=unclassified Streptomyces TaxID=2593676 RepID=UPI00131B91EC|nr:MULTISPECIES: hypothetical protein [unclassified Streptomyces]